MAQTTSQYWVSPELHSIRSTLLYYNRTVTRLLEYSLGTERLVSFRLLRVPLVVEVLTRNIWSSLLASLAFASRKAVTNANNLFRPNSL